MNLLLYSDFYCMPISDVLNALKGKQKPLTCLFCNYAEEEKSNYYNRTIKHLREIFDNIIELHPGYKFNNAIDAIFVNGGSNFELVYKLKKYNQFDKLKKMVENGTLYIGNSAGSMLCSKNFLFSKLYEPPEIEDCIAEENCTGFGFIDKSMLMHASKYKFREKKGLIFDKETYHTYITIKLKQPNPLKIPNNGVYIVADKLAKLKVYPWKKIIEQKSKS